MAKTERVEMRVSPEFIRMIDDWRRAQDKIPNRTEAIEELCKSALSKSTANLVDHRKVITVY